MPLFVSNDFIVLPFSIRTVKFINNLGALVTFSLAEYLSSCV